jgi:cytochrome c556
VKTGDKTALKMIWQGEVNFKLPKQQFVQDIISCLKQYKF